MIRRLSVLSLVLSAVALAADPSDILKVENAMRAARLNKDVAAMDRLTAPEFIWVTRSGEVSKEQFLQRLKSGDLAKYDLIGEQKVRFAGEVAIVTGARLLHSNPERKIMVTNVWIKKEGRWQRFSSHTSELPEPKK